MSTDAETPNLNVLICYATGHPCGTDTVIVGHGPCAGKDGRCYIGELAALRTAHEAAQSQIRALLKLSGNRLADYTKAQAEIAALRKSELRWKRMAEFQYGRRAYPDHIELAQGALDEFYKTNFDGKDVSN